MSTYYARQFSNKETTGRREWPVGMVKLKWMKYAAVVVVHFATIWASTSSTASTTATSFFHRDNVIRNQRFGRYRIDETRNLANKQSAFGDTFGQLRSFQIFNFPTFVQTWTIAEDDGLLDFFPTEMTSSSIGVGEVDKNPFDDMVSDEILWP